MKYWWLERYQELKITLIPELVEDIHFFIVMPRDYEQRYLEIDQKNVEELKEEEMLILLYYVFIHKKIKNSKIMVVIRNLLEIPDNRMPLSDYSLKELLEEVKNLKKIRPTRQKLEVNNIAACYHCMQVFYVDKIGYINKSGSCLCPYCSSSKLYFDNDLMPMDYLYLKLCQLYYSVTPLGCRYKNLQKLLKKSVKIKVDKKNLNTDSGVMSFETMEERCQVKEESSAIYIAKPSIFAIKKTITSYEEMILCSYYAYGFKRVESLLLSELTIQIDSVPKFYLQTTALSLFLMILEHLGHNPYLKQITLICPTMESCQVYEKCLRTLIRY